MALTREAGRRRQRGSGEARRQGVPVRGGGVGGRRGGGRARRKRIAWAVVGTAAALALSSPLARSAFQVVAAAHLVRRCAPWAVTAAEIVEFLQEPEVVADLWGTVRALFGVLRGACSHLWLIMRGLPIELAVIWRDVADGAHVHAPIRTRCASTSPPRGEMEDAQRLVRAAIDEEEDGECGICTSKLTPDNIAIMSCCVPEAVGGRVHVVCAGCWGRLPEPKKCPHCSRRAERCGPLEMVGRIRAAAAV